MNRKEQFAKVFEPHGRALPHADTQPDLAAAIQRHLNWYDGIDPHIHVGIVENPAFNAIACRHRFGEFVAIYVGAISQLTVFAYQLLSDPTCYPEIGDVSLEDPDPSVLGRLMVGDWQSALSLRWFPACPVRTAAADRIAECACLSLCLHELAHIQGGHLDLIYEEMSLSEYEEMCIAPLSWKESLLLRALELEADSVALVNSLSIWRVLFKNNDYKELAPVGATRSWLIEDPEKAVVRWFAKNTKSTPIFDTSSHSQNATVSELTELDEQRRNLWSRLERHVQAREQRFSRLQART